MGYYGIMWVFRGFVARYIRRKMAFSAKKRLMFSWNRTITGLAFDFLKTLSIDIILSYKCHQIFKICFMIKCNCKQ